MSDHAARLPVIGVVGGIGSGKTSIARAAAQHLPVLILDGDAAGHETLKDSYVKLQLRTHFGESIFTEQGEVDRRSLARLVFGPTSEHTRNRKLLERIVHPSIRIRLFDQIQQAEREQQAEIILLDAAVLLEAGWKDLCDALVFIDTPQELRLKHVMEQRNWSESELERREQSQLPVSEKRRLADFVVDNSGTLEHSAAQLVKFLEQFRAENSH